MNMKHPAFSNIEDYEIQEALSEPFVGVETYVVFNNIDILPAEQLTPLAIGAIALHEGQFKFMAGWSCQSTTPLNHLSQYLDAYSYYVGKAHAPIFEDEGDDKLSLELIKVLQGNVNRTVCEENLRVLAGFMLGLTNNSKMPTAGFVVAKKAFDAMDCGLEQGFDEVEDIFDEAISEQELDSDSKTTREGLLDTVKELTIPTSVGRLLPKPSLVRGVFMQHTPVREFYEKSGKAQRKTLIAERRASVAFN